MMRMRRDALVNQWMLCWLQTESTKLFQWQPHALWLLVRTMKCLKVHQLCDEGKHTQKCLVHAHIRISHQSARPLECKPYNCRAKHLSSQDRGCCTALRTPKPVSKTVAYVCSPSAPAATNLEACDLDLLIRNGRHTRPDLGCWR